MLQFSSSLLPQLLVVLTLSLARVTAQGLSVTDYAPSTGITCPQTSLLRVFSAQNQSLNPSEIDYIQGRERVTLDAWNTWIGNGSNLGYNLSLSADSAPRVGIALSGGGFRASLYGAGVLNSLDARNVSAKQAGTGGLLQVASYIAGLSGGSWLTSSLYSNDFPTMQDMVFGNGDELAGWLLDLDLFLPDGKNIFNDDNQAYYGSIMYSVIAKASKGIDTSLTDPWSRALSYHFLNQTNRENFFTNDSAHGAGQLWSDIPTSQVYQQQSVPFPIILANSRPNGSNYTGVLPPEAAVFEFSPLELASFDPSLSAAIDLKFAGSNLTNGKPVNDQACLEGLDETGFVMGTSSSLFNQILDERREQLMNSEYFEVVTHLLARLLEDVRTQDDDVANWPNSFRNVAPSTFVDTNSDWLELIDGGSNGEVVPFGPLLVKARGLDVIVGVDSNANDDNNWPSGESAIFTANRTSKLLNDTHQQFPPIPSTVQAFIDAGANQRPTFFGCDPQQSPPEYPLVVYLPNSPPLTGDNPVTNTDTFKLSYTQKHSQLFIEQVFSNTIGGFVPSSNSPDSNFGECLQCAAIDRARLKSTPSISRSDVCSKCFKQYCFDPTNPPTKSELSNRKYVFVDPDSQSYFQRHKAAIIGGIVGGVVALIVLVAGIIYLYRRKKQTKKPVQYHTLTKSASQTSD
ncbi:phospholipase B [Desarmillaria tabescens]|uniref:Lysophospholipase n=1 Tax=Armillaria tabescens TaxID=1929756 RepID=A0AA39TR30_ARMTA|nr:phospholipase B [Desarmillaria tabescens]KAK0463558.1 phospholipase B [Desarmillaria tabescens]